MRLTDGADPGAVRPVLMSAQQALVEALMAEVVAARSSGRRRGGFVSGYPGSPLTAVDGELRRREQELLAAGVHHRPAVNEELAVTALHGSQLAPQLPGPAVDGVVGLWYGKAPGLDRAVDALRHANAMGAHPRGGVVVAVGDDPAASSSSLPSASEHLLAEVGLPVLVPSDAAETLELARAAWEVSRCSGLWTALRLPTRVADSLQSFPLPDDHAEPVDGPPGRRVEGRVLGSVGVELERLVHGPRRAEAVRTARRLGVDRLLRAAPAARVGVVAVGPLLHDALAVLEGWGVGPEDVRILHVRMPTPCDPAALSEFADGLERVVVLEEKRPLVAPSMVSALVGAGRPVPHVISERDGDEVVQPAWGVRTPDQVEEALARLLRRPHRRSDPGAGEPVAVPTAVRRGAPAAPGPSFCAGCPHTTSTRTRPGTVVGAGVGCHGMVLLADDPRRGDVVGLTQMGGEGAQWIGAQPFGSVGHVVQHMGDGTLAHSGTLAVRAAVSAGAHVTFKVLLNGTVAMTGGQEVEGGADVAGTVRRLLDEGVARVVVTTDEPSAVGRDLPGGVEVRRRSDLAVVEAELARVPGTTAVVHVQECAVELRRARNRGERARPRRHLHIDERLCEGCADCVATSECSALTPTPTDHGLKYQIDHDSCVVDEACLQARCPAVVSVRSRRGPSPVPIEDPPGPLLGPPSLGELPLDVRIVGRGGTGVLTTTWILAEACHRAGLSVRARYATGLAQKGGPVSSDLLVTDGPSPGHPLPGTGRCDLLVVLDPQVATAAALTGVEPGVTAVVAAATRPSPGGAGSSVGAVPDALAGRERTWWLDPERHGPAPGALRRHLGPALLGLSSRAGLLPLPPDVLEAATGDRVDRAAVSAMRWGRAAAASAAPEPTLDELLAARSADLRDYQSERLAQRYRAALKELRRVEERRCGATDVTRAAAVQLHRLLARKDAYEVARLLLLDSADEAVKRRFGAGSRVTYHLAPPVGRWADGRRKVAVGVGARPLLRVLRAGRRLRDGAMDPFSRLGTAPLDRELVEEYLEVLRLVTDALGPSNREAALELVGSAEVIRGFGDVRRESAERFRERLPSLLEELARSRGPRPEERV